ncbi:MAG: Spy/CpxP family protein refolding chaperone [Dongiaceae bacterium]
MSNRTRIAAPSLAFALALALAGGTARAQDDADQTAHPAAGAAAAQGTASPAMPMASDDDADMPAMMGDMMQMMGRMMQMMPQMCGDMQGGNMQGGAMQGGAGMMDQGMMGGGMGRPMRGALAHRGMGGWDGRAPFRHLEGDLAFYRTELAITDAQGGPWNAFADAVRGAAKTLAAAHQAKGPGDDEGTALDQMQRRIDLLSAHLAALKQIQAAAAPLYAALSPEQKKTADDLMGESMRPRWR